MATVKDLEARLDELQAELAAANARLDAAARWASQVECRLTSTGSSVKLSDGNGHGYRRGNNAVEVY